MKIRRIVPDLHGDPAASRDFYEQVLGLEQGMDMGWIATWGSVSNETAQLTVMSKDATAPVAPDVSIEVEDVDAVHERTVAGGYEIVHPLTDEPWGVRRFFVRDPNGTVINVMQHIE
jgi:predicted enzyme related to lactoylglutathione lyase